MSYLTEDSSLFTRFISVPGLISSDITNAPFGYGNYKTCKVFKECRQDGVGILPRVYDSATTTDHLTTTISASLFISYIRVPPHNVPAADVFGTVTFH